jgi:predicted transcriptional regulator
MSYHIEDEKMVEKRITVRLDGEAAEWVQRKAEELNTTVSSVVRDALISYKDEDYKQFKELLKKIGMQKLLEEANKHE